MKNVWIGVCFLAGTALGSFSATQISEELVYNLPSKFLTFGRVRETQVARKLYHGKAPEDGKVIYILGGSAGYASANELTLSDRLTQRMRYPVRVYNLSTSSQNLAESYAMIDKMPDFAPGQGHVVMTWNGHRVTASARASLEASMRRRRILLRYDTLREEILDKDILSQPFADGVATEGAGEEFMATIDRTHTSSVGSHWLKYFVYDKMRKLTRGRAGLFADKNVYTDREFDPRRISQVVGNYNIPRRRAGYERNHQRYYDILLAKFEDRSAEQLATQRDFALYLFAAGNALAEEKDYAFAAMELPLHARVHDDPLIDDYRRSFNVALSDLGDREGFQTFYLDATIEALRPFEFWHDAGHMNSAGKQVMEDYYVDILESVLTDGEDGIYGMSPPSEVLAPESLLERSASKTTEPLRGALSSDPMDARQFPPERVVVEE